MDERPQINTVRNIVLTVVIRKRIFQEKRGLSTKAEWKSYKMALSHLSHLAGLSNEHHRTTSLYYGWITDTFRTYRPTGQNDFLPDAIRSSEHHRKWNVFAGHRQSIKRTKLRTPTDVVFSFPSGLSGEMWQGHKLVSALYQCILCTYRQ